MALSLSQETIIRGMNLDETRKALALMYVSWASMTPEGQRELEDVVVALETRRDRLTPVRKEKRA